MEKKFINHELSIKAWIEERPAYKRSYKDGGFIVKFTLTSFTRWDDDLVKVVDTSGDSHLFNVLRGHVSDLMESGIDCTYLLDPKNYNRIFLPWVYSQNSIIAILENAEQELDEATNKLSEAKAKDKIDSLHSQILVDEETILLNEKMINM